MMCQIVVGTLIGVVTAANGYFIFDWDNPQKMCIAWAWIVFGNLFFSMIANIFHLP